MTLNDRMVLVLLILSLCAIAAMFAYTRSWLALGSGAVVDGIIVQFLREH